MCNCEDSPCCGCDQEQALVMAEVLDGPEQDYEDVSDLAAIMRYSPNWESYT